MTLIQRLTEAVHTAASVREQARRNAHAQLEARRNSLFEAKSVTEAEVGALDEELHRTRGHLAAMRHRVGEARDALAAEEEELGLLLERRTAQVHQGLETLDAQHAQYQRQARVRDAHACFAPGEDLSPAQLETRLQLEAPVAAKLRSGLIARTRTVSKALEASRQARAEADELRKDLDERLEGFDARVAELVQHHGVSRELLDGIGQAPRRTARRMWRELFEPALAQAKAERAAGVVGKDPLPGLRPDDA